MGECNLTEVCKFFDKNHSQCKGELECPKKPIHKKKKKLTYANEVETLQALVERARGIGEDKYHGGPAECAACIYNRETVNDCHYDGGFISLTDTKKRSACLVKDICIRQYEKDTNLTGNQIADECQKLLNTLVLCPGHNCGFVTKEREANRTYGGNYRCEKCSTIYDSSLWIAHWKPVKKFESGEITIKYEDEHQFQCVLEMFEGRRARCSLINKIYWSIKNRAEQMGLIK